MHSTGLAIETIYRQRADHLAAAETRLGFQERTVARLRLAVFVTAVGLLFAGWKSEQGSAWYWAGGTALGGFFAAVAYHEHVRRRIERTSMLRRINEQAIARLRRDWRGLPETPVAVPPGHRAVAGDLDLFGHASLFHLLCSASTPIGIRVLRDWFLEPASPEEIQQRQEAVAELAPQLDLRQTLTLESRLLADRGRASERFVEWAEGEPWLAARPRLKALFRIMSASVLLLVVLMCSRALSFELGASIVFGLLFANAFFTALVGAKAHAIFRRVSLRQGEVARYLRIFELLVSMPAESRCLGDLQREMTNVGGGALRRLRQLHRIAVLAMMHRSALLAVFVYLPLQLLFLYDVHVLTLLEAWQSRYGRFARGWFLALGKFEALASLATLAHDEPDWTTPDVSTSATAVEARALGHPLLPGECRVGNDVEVGPAGAFLLVTGSNMSGKSTLLRAIGVNAVLAQAGAPVCADSLIMPPAVLATSMRIRDSLEDGVSFYMAELMRLKEIVDLARDPPSRGGRVLLYLLDEILLGTNSRERHLAVVRVLEHLLQCGAIGAISTHDLELATSGPLAGVCRCVHFCETLHGEEAERPMTFDYKLRPGVATTTNALKLLEIVGLDSPSRP